MKPALFKSNVSKIALLLGELLKYVGPKIKEAIRSRVKPMLNEPVKSMLKKNTNGSMVNEINITKEMETYKYKMLQYLKDKR